ncbi:polysaccharide deacetylase family protein [Deinococcus rubellus]|uniref:Polysaccharide deacetylase family protein n=1 Tax=Deinococcus rubellus TaxID=1889240 RepID=A0ABY5YGD9_9DEIO|nr:polysaccharide deacetylase family protein [Deinococcus rubellus]UWX64140.1 polysaccharide deacetylase family protein [Deinococcus rubellus]
MKRVARLGWKGWLGLSALTLTASIGVPYLLVQTLGLGLRREGRRHHYDLALTFDDGPDPLTTPAVLDALAAVGAKATFFVLVGQAEAHPELIARMQREGHQIELHAVKHVHPWLRSPWGALLDPLLGAARLARVTGTRPSLHRPPHGAYRLATLIGQRWAGLEGVHWSVEARDWHPASTPQSVTGRVLALAHPGAVIVMHDAGPGAVNTVLAVPGLLAELAGRGYTFHTLATLPGLAPLGRADLPRRLSRLTDQVFDRLGQIGPVSGRADNAFRVGVLRLSSGPMLLRSGQVVAKGAKVLDLHVRSDHMVDFGVKRGMRRAIAWDLPWLADEIVRRPDWRDAEAIYTLGTLTSLASMFGFESHDLPPAETRRLTRWGTLLRRAYGTARKAPSARLSIMGLDDFLARYAGKGKDQAEGGPAPRPDAGGQRAAPEVTTPESARRSP